MTNNTFILEWEGSELKNGTMRYEKFKVITGSDKQNLNFYSTFFINNNRFKKGEIYQLSTSGNFVQDSSGLAQVVPGGFVSESLEIIQGIDHGGYEFEKVHPSLLIKELYEEKEEKSQKVNQLENDLQQKKQDVNKVNQELFTARNEVTSLQDRLGKLQIEKDRAESEKDRISRELSLSKTELENKERDFSRKEEELTSSRSEISQLSGKFTSLQDERKKMENDWITPEKKIQLLQEKESLNNQLKTQRRNNQLLINSLEEFRSQQLSKTIQTKLQEIKEEKNKLKVGISSRLEENQKFLLDNLLEKQEDFDLALFEDVNRATRTFSRAQEKLQDVKDKLLINLGSEEIEELCRMQTEISKLENGQKQWEKMESQQIGAEQFEAVIGTPPATPRNN